MGLILPIAVVSLVSITAAPPVDSRINVDLEVQVEPSQPVVLDAPVAGGIFDKAWVRFRPVVTNRGSRLIEFKMLECSARHIETGILTQQSWIVPDFTRVQPRSTLRFLDEIEMDGLPGLPDVEDYFFDVACKLSGRDSAQLNVEIEFSFRTQ